MMLKREQKQKDDDEEAFSLDDKNEVEDQTQVLEVQEEENKDFEFGSWRTDSVLREPNMCAAEDVFFQGQILPLRLSVSSNCSGMAGIRLGSRCVSRSESMDHGYGSANSRSSSVENPYSFYSSSGKRCISRSESMDHRCDSTTSRKRSIENPNSISSSSVNRWVSKSDSMDHRYGSANSRSGRIERRSSISSSSGNSLTTIRELEWNLFHAHPSPKPQIWQTAAWPEQGGNRSRRSTIWGFFRLGLVRMPEMELEDLKRKLLDKSKSCENSSSSSSNSNSRGRNRLKVFEGFSCCKCSVSMVETIASRIATMKKVNGNAREEKLSKVEKKQEKQRKQGMAHRRSFEWLKQFSVAVADLPKGASHRE